jgi:hypothetical protein
MRGILQRRADSGCVHRTRSALPMDDQPTRARIDNDTSRHCGYRVGLARQTPPSPPSSRRPSPAAATAAGRCGRLANRNVRGKSGSRSGTRQTWAHRASRPKRPRSTLSLVATKGLLGETGGGGRNRTGVHGFAGRCMTTLPPRQGYYTGSRPTPAGSGWRLRRGGTPRVEPMRNSAPWPQGSFDIRLERAFPEIWSGKRGSNSRPQPWQGCALPLSYSRAKQAAILTSVDGGCQSSDTHILCPHRDSARP